jgi:outer membrane protein assembly factor BamA
VKDTYLYNMGPMEDIQLGPGAWIGFSATHDFRGSKGTFPGANLGFGIFEGSPGWGYVRSMGSVGARLENGELTNIDSSVSTNLYLRTSRRGMLAFQATARSLHRTEDPSQLLLDSYNHLRGYKVYAYEGSRRLTATLEFRQVGWEAKWWTGGLVLFTDSGIVWREGESPRDMPFLLGSGLGLRLGVPWFMGAPVFSMDFGYGFKDENFDVNMSIGQRF